MSIKILLLCTPSEVTYPNNMETVDWTDLSPQILWVIVHVRGVRLIAISHKNVIGGEPGGFKCNSVYMCRLAAHMY